MNRSIFAVILTASLTASIAASFTACSSLATAPDGAPPAQGKADALISMAADYAVWDAQNPDGDYVDEVLIPRALDAASITRAVDNPAEALQAWATGTETTDESALLTAWFYREIEGLQQRYEVSEVNLVVAKLLQELLMASR